MCCVPPNKQIDLVGKVIILQHYKNDSSVDIEAKFVFPLDELAGMWRCKTTLVDNFYKLIISKINM